MDSRDPGAWDAEAALFDEEPDHGLRDPQVRESWRRLLISQLPQIPSRVADLGCGSGSLAQLVAEQGHRVDGVDFSPEMVRRASAKAGSYPGTTFVVGDAAEPPLREGQYAVVLCRHVLWALPHPAAALDRWARLLTPGGRLALVEGSWSTGAGLTGVQTLDLVRGAGLEPELVPLDDPAYWGGPIDDERYLVVGRSGSRRP